MYIHICIEYNVLLCGCAISEGDIEKSIHILNVYMDAQSHNSHHTPNIEYTSGTHTPTTRTHSPRDYHGNMNTHGTTSNNNELTRLSPLMSSNANRYGSPPNTNNNNTNMLPRVYEKEKHISSIHKHIFEKQMNKDIHDAMVRYVYICVYMSVYICIYIIHDAMVRYVYIYE